MLQDKCIIKMGFLCNRLKKLNKQLSSSWYHFVLVVVCFYFFRCCGQTSVL